MEDNRIKKAQEYLENNVPLYLDEAKAYNAFIAGWDGCIIETHNKDNISSLKMKSIKDLVLPHASDALIKAMVDEVPESYRDNIISIGVVIEGFLSQNHIIEFTNELSRLVELGAIRSLMSPPIVMPLAIISPTIRTIMVLIAETTPEFYQLPKEKKRETSQFINDEGEMPLIVWRNFSSDWRLHDAMLKDVEETLPLYGKDFLAPQFPDRTIFKEAEDAYGDDDRFVPINTADEKYVVVKESEYNAVINFMQKQLGIANTFINPQSI